MKKYCNFTKWNTQMESMERSATSKKIEHSKQQTELARQNKQKKKSKKKYEETVAADEAVIYGQD